MNLRRIWPRKNHIFKFIVEFLINRNWKTSKPFFFQNSGYNAHAIRLALVFNSIELVEQGVTLQLTLIDTPGFGDQLNREPNFEPILGYIDSKHEQYFAAERKEKRADILDNRVHCLLYFLPPTGLNRVNDLDLEFLQRICTKVNVIPVIGKSDSLLPEECARYKKAVSVVFNSRFYGNSKIMMFVLILHFTQKIGNLLLIWNNIFHLLSLAVIAW